MIPADRITDGIVYKTHFADWEKLAKPTLSREMDATHVRAQSFSVAFILFHALLSVGYSIPKRSINPICLIDFRFIFYPITSLRLTIEFFDAKRISFSVLTFSIK